MHDNPLFARLTRNAKPPSLRACLWLAAGLGLATLLACAAPPSEPLSPLPLATLTPSSTPSPTPTATPAASPLEPTTVLFGTPDPLFPPPCAIQATRIPPPGAPTYIPGPFYNPTSDPPRFVDPHVEICASGTTLRVGDLATLTAQPIDIGQPYLYIDLSDRDIACRTTITVENDQIGERVYDAAPCRVLELVSAGTVGPGWFFVFRARQAGSTEIVISARGEVHYGYPGPATWDGAGVSDALILTVVP